MTPRKLTISWCDQCPHFDNEYYSYNEECRKLGRKIEKDVNTDYIWSYPIPDDCPLEKE
jgi:hypothetical protein